MRHTTYLHATHITHASHTHMWHTTYLHATHITHMRHTSHTHHTHMRHTSHTHMLVSVHPSPVHRTVGGVTKYCFFSRCGSRDASSGLSGSDCNFGFPDGGTDCIFAAQGHHSRMAACPVPLDKIYHGLVKPWTPLICALYCKHGEDMHIICIQENVY